MGIFTTYEVKQENLDIYANHSSLSFASANIDLISSLDERLTIESRQDLVKYDYSHSIQLLMSNILTLDKRWIRAESEFKTACDIPGVDPNIIHRHTNRIRLIVELVGKMDYLWRLLGKSHEKK